MKSKELECLSLHRQYTIVSKIYKNKAWIRWLRLAKVVFDTQNENPKCSSLFEFLYVYKCRFPLLLFPLLLSFTSFLFSHPYPQLVIILTIGRTTLFSDETLKPQHSEKDCLVVLCVSNGIGIFYCLVSQKEDTEMGKNKVYKQ